MIVGSYDQTVAAIIHMVTGGAAVAVGVSWIVSVLAISSRRWSSSTGSETVRDCLGSRGETTIQMLPNTDVAQNQEGRKKKISGRCPPPGWVQGR